MNTGLSNMDCGLAARAAPRNDDPGVCLCLQTPVGGGPGFALGGPARRHRRLCRRDLLSAARRRFRRQYDRQPRRGRVGGGAGQWKLAIWCASLLVAFLLGVLAARLVLRTQHSARLSLLLEAAIVIVAANGVLGIAAVPVLAASMALQNEAVTHGIVALNVGFITGDLQTLGERLIPAAAGGEPRKRDNPVALLLTILVFYAVGAAIGALLAGWGEAALILPAALLATAALLPERWTGLAAQRQ